MGGNETVISESLISVVLLYCRSAISANGSSLYDII
jgi:hypothetical protein